MKPDRSGSPIVRQPQLNAQVNAEEPVATALSSEAAPQTGVQLNAPTEPPPAEAEPPSTSQANL